MCTPPSGISNRELKVAIACGEKAICNEPLCISNRELKGFANRFGIDEQTLAERISNRELKVFHRPNAGRNTPAGVSDREERIERLLYILHILCGSDYWCLNCELKGVSFVVWLYGFYCCWCCGAPFAVPASGAFVGVWAWLWGVACVYLAYFVGGVED